MPIAHLEANIYWLTLNLRPFLLNYFNSNFHMDIMYLCSKVFLIVVMKNIMLTILRPFGENVDLPSARACHVLSIIIPVPAGCHVTNSRIV